MKKNNNTSAQCFFIRFFAETIGNGLPVYRVMRTFRPWAEVAESRFRRPSPWQLFLEALERGEAPAKALDPLAGYLPELFIDAVRRAEAAGCLRQALPELVANVRFQNDLESRYTAFFTMAITQIMVTLVIAVSFCIFVLTRFGLLVKELLPSSPKATVYEKILSFIPPPRPGGFSRAAELPVWSFWPELAWVGGFFGLLWLLYWLKNRIPSFAGPGAREVARFSFVRTLAAMLSVGADWPQACELAAAASPSHWLRRKIRRHEKFFGPFEEYLLEAALKRGRPIEGCVAIEDLIAERMNFHLKRAGEWLEWIGLALRSIIAGGSALLIFCALTDLISRI